MSQWPHTFKQCCIFQFFKKQQDTKTLLFSCLFMNRKLSDSPWLWVGLCLALVGDPPPALCPCSKEVEPSPGACLGPGLLRPDSPEPGAAAAGPAGPAGPLSCLGPLPCCRALGPSLEETLCRKSWRLVTAFQPRGPRSELGTETMALAMPSSIVRWNVEWRSGGVEGGGQGVEGRSEAWTVFKTEGAEELGGKAEEEGQLGRRCNHTTGRDGEEGGGKSCYCAVHSPGESHFWSGLKFFPLFAFTSTPHCSVNTSTHGASLWIFVFFTGMTAVMAAALFT